MAKILKIMSDGVHFQGRSIPQSGICKYMACNSSQWDRVRTYVLAKSTKKPYK